MTHKLVTLVLSIAVIISLMIVGCAPEAAPPEEEVTPPEEEEAAPPAAPEEEVFEWRMQTTKTPGSIDWECLQYSVDYLREMTDGRIDITMFPSGALVSYPEMLDALGDGTFEVAQNVAAYYAGADPGFGLLCIMPGIFENIGDVITWVDHFGGREIWTEAYAKYNVHFAAPFSDPAEPIMSKVPLRTLDDFKGLKIRTPTGTTHDLFAKLGAVPTYLPGGEIYGALDTGLIDAAERLGLKANWDEGLHEVTDYILYPSFHSPIGILDISVNMDAWNKLPDDLKACYNAFGIVNNRHYYYTEMTLEHAALQDIIDYGLEHTQLSAKDMAKARELSAEVCKDYAKKSPLATKVMSSVLDYMREIGKME